MRILVVEDDDALRGLWSDVLHEAGHDVVAVAAFEAARDRLHLTSFDVVVLDLFLGSEIGLSIATLASYANPDCRVVVVTGTGVFAHGELFDLAPSVVSVLRKPIPVAELVAVCEHGTPG